jgi:hypothetical protein
VTAAGRTAGARRLAEVVELHGPREVGRRLGASESSVRSWVRGQRSPTGAARRVLFETFAIEASSWGNPDAARTPGQDAPASPPPSPPPRTSSGPRATAPPATAAGKAAEQVNRLHGEIVAAKEKGAGWRDLASLETAYTSALRNLGRLSGELEVSESSILRSAAWGRVMRVVSGVLERHPGIARELAAAIERVGGGE